MHIEQVTNTEIFMEGDSTITVETLVIVESIILWTPEDEAEFTPMFAPMFAPDFAETLVIRVIAAAPFIAPVILDVCGRQTWVC